MRMLVILVFERKYTSFFSFGKMISEKYSLMSEKYLVLMVNFL